MVMETTAPETNSSVPVTWVATSTGMGVPFERLAGDQPLETRAWSPSPSPRRSAEQLDEVGDVIGAHVEHRPAAAQIVEAGRRDASVRARGTRRRRCRRPACRSRRRRSACARSGGRRRGRCPARSRPAGSSASARSITLRASTMLTPSGFSEWTCLPALSTARLTSVWASGTVRLTTISMSSRFSIWSTRMPGTPNSVARCSAAARAHIGDRAQFDIGKTASWRSCRPC